MKKIGRSRWLCYWYLHGGYHKIMVPTSRRRKITLSASLPMAHARIRPALVTADGQGNIFDNPDLYMVCRRGSEFALPGPADLIPLPEESELFLLPGRKALGLNPETGRLEETDETAVAAFIPPAHTLTAHAAYRTERDAPILPLFAYGAVGFANGRFYVCARKIDNDPRQVFTGISRKLLEQKAHALLKAYPENRLMQHLAAKCALTYACPAARNLCLGRHEAPLPVAKACNARCIGCISQQEKDSKIRATPQNRLTFTPTAGEIAEVMLHHSRNEAAKPIFSFGQGCEGEPLTEAELLLDAIALFRSKNGRGTVNLNSNASMPDAVAPLARAGLSSLRVSLCSAREEAYVRYSRPQGYSFADVRRSIMEAKKNKLFVSLNLLFFPGFTDTEPETQALVELVAETGADCVQLRNLNIDPELYLEHMSGLATGPGLGFANFRKRLCQARPGLKLGYFNPYVAEK